MLIDLTPYHIQRPEKIRWRFNDQVVESVLDSVPSKSLRKFLRNLDKYLIQNNLRYELIRMTEKRYQSWLKFYLEKVKEHNYRPVATADWFQKKQAQGKKVQGLFIYQGDELVSAGMITDKEPNVAVLAMSASKYLHISGKSNASLGAILNYLFLKEMKQAGFTAFSGGSSRNAFGVFNSIGYLEYKMRMGYVPSPDKGTQFLTTVPQEHGKPVVFFGEQNGVLKLFSIQGNEKPVEFEKNTLQHAGIEHKELSV